MKKNAFVLFLACCFFLSLPAQAIITVAPSIVGDWPTLAGEDLTFDLIITDPCGISPVGFEATLGNVSGPGTLTFDKTSSIGIKTDPDYWLFGNSGGLKASDNLDGTYTFGDGSGDTLAVALAPGDHVARYAFEFDGTPGDYTFTFNLGIDDSFFVDEFFVAHAIAFNPGTFPGGDDWFTVTLVPEPATLVLLGLGGFMIRKRRA